MLRAHCNITHINLTVVFHARYRNVVVRVGLIKCPLSMVKFSAATLVLMYQNCPSQFHCAFNQAVLPGSLTRNV